MICLLLASLATVVAALWLGYPDMGLLPWVGVVFGGIVLVMMVLPRNWQRWRLAELAWDERHLYLLNGGEDRALACQSRAGGHGAGIARWDTMASGSISAWISGWMR